uniref:Anaphase-promoting complex subunit 4 WD40 domain-containing protein n=1 Tax=Chromera velia CCMP2878 TaxID=1169474 RepID=A0A0G4F7Z5_9ALVE|eukprot:Cvel_15705.t1-p1 / transcript=Cvel_15705.t1 / gene=Cvel_15705 / organism=Chromera_velia_CCMP2878 / gene_product=Telomerase Cajal body protein 1, putative / transcript_product=Telomerase Cajal body protein 1, putative / location=Cvel_scaffold1173:41199-46248(-) / protein_length=495 / sequence_SO=supercontig / SO=protein_coding / is_pseudo=false
MPLSLLHESVAPFDPKFTGGENNFIKRSLWSPDGSAILTVSEDACVRLFALPAQTIDALQGSAEQPQATPLLPWAAIAEPEGIADCCWLPQMKWEDPSSCVFACAARGQPVHLWSASTGVLCGSFMPMDNAEEVSSPFSLAFYRDGSVLYSGHSSCVRLFDTQRPGRQTEQWTLATRKGREGLKGIVSAIAPPVGEGAGAAGLCAVGSYSRKIALMDRKSRPRGGVKRAEAVLQREGGMGGVTSLQWLETGGEGVGGDMYLLSGHRKDNALRLWDLRSYDTPVCEYPRTVATHQKFQFDCLPIARLQKERQKTKGGQGGIGETSEVPMETDTETETETGVVVATGTQEGGVLFYGAPNGGPLAAAPAHFSPSTGCSFHPTLPLLLTSSGTRETVAQSGGKHVSSSSESESDREEGLGHSDGDGSKARRGEMGAGNRGVGRERKRAKAESPEATESTGKSQEETDTCYQPVNALRVWLVDCALLADCLAKNEKTGD